MEQLKRDSSHWMKTSGKFPFFEKWGKEYFGFSKDQNQKAILIEYIKNQKEHHTHISFEDEMKELLSQEGMEWKDNLLT